MAVYSATNATDAATATDPPARSFTLGEVLRIVAVALTAGTAIGYLVSHYSDETLNILARILSIVAITTVIHMIFEVKRRSRIDRVDHELQQIGQRLAEQPAPQRCEACYAEGYVDGLTRATPDAHGGGRHLRSV